VYTSRHQRLDQSDIISTYSTIKIRRLEYIKNELEWWLYGRWSLLLLPENGVREENGNESLNNRNRVIPKSGRPIKIFEMILYSYYMLSANFLYYF